MRPTDPLYASQVHFTQIGNIERIWDEFDGSGVSVAVYDDGVQPNHPDLNDSYDATLNFRHAGILYGPTPLNGNAGHGTSVAGLIAAEAGNGIGGVGVAFGASVTGINYLDVIQTLHDPFRPADMAIYRAAMRHAANFDVMSNSWAWGDTFSYEQNTNNSDSYASRELALLAEVVATGRGGLGTVIVQAAGNDGGNAGGDGWHVSRFTATIAATETDGFVADYSNWGSTILIAGPAAEVTTDMQGGAGYNRSDFDADPLPLDYTSDFGGTSAATPVVSGVVSLMLDANDGLGWRDVHNILALSASHTGSAYGSAAAGFEIGGWVLMGGGAEWNGGGRAIHYSYGYGMVDAFAAVRVAEAWKAFGRVAQTSANERKVQLDYSGGAQFIPDFDGFSAGVQEITLTSTEDIQIETVYVTVDVTHSYANDLTITLVAPDGAFLPVVSGVDNSSLMDFGLTWTFGVESLRGYSTLGDWTVRFEDDESGDTGFVSDVKIEFFGASQTANDIFHFTDDFLALAAQEAARRVIDDVDDGIDWVNMAAIAGRVVANLAAGGAVTVDGGFWTRLAAGVAEIENLFSGDGNDVITGNALANQLIGGRGNDALRGSSGNDRLDGAAGNDNLDGGSHNDRLTGGFGNDLLKGGAGNDTMTGGGGYDRFVFERGFGRDQITDFRDNVDSLHLDNALWTGNLTAAQVLAQHAGYNAAGVATLTFGGSILTLTGLTNHALLLDDIVII